MLYLYGDSILDNAIYVAPGDAVIDHMRRTFGTEVLLCARDGATVRDAMAQIGRQRPLPDDIAVLSIGGNDLLNIVDTHITAQPLEVDNIVTAVEQMHVNYQRVVTYLARSYQHVVLCNVYYPPEVATLFDGVVDSATIHRIIAIHNQLVATTAQMHRAALLDGARVCDDAADFVHVIEPSATGGAKLVAALAQLPLFRQ